MRNQDKDIKQKVAEYMEIMGIYAPEDQEAAAGKKAGKAEKAAAGKKPAEDQKKKQQRRGK